MRTAVLLAACALALIPATQAQDANSHLSIIQVGQCDPSPIPYAGNCTVRVTVGVGCADALKSQTASTDHKTLAVAVTVANAPSWLTPTPVSIPLDAKACPTNTQKGYLSDTGSLALKVTPEAPGVVPFSLNFTASMPALPTPPATTAPPFTSTQSNIFNVSYHPEHTITPSIQFPYKMTGHVLNFTVTVVEKANARSMVMFNNLKASPGTITGLQSIPYEPPATKTFQVTYTAPDSSWTEAKVTFHSYSHFLINGTNQAGGENLVKDETWVIQNGNPEGGAGTTKPSPLAGAPAMVTLAVAALVASRRKK